MVEMMLLGFLMDGEKTGYEIKKYMENSTHYFFNTGFSSIYPKFKKLEKDGRVQVSQRIKNGKLNKIYTITDSGRVLFKQWLELPPRIGRIRDEALLKVFFYDYLEKEQIQEQLALYNQEIKDQLQAINDIKDRVTQYKLEPWKRTTLEFGIRYYTFMEECFNDMLDKLENKSTS